MKVEAGAGIIPGSVMAPMPLPPAAEDGKEGIEDGGCGMEGYRDCMMGAVEAEERWAGGG